MSGLPFAIAVAPNGARRTRKDHPRLPMTAAEIARDAAEAREAGAAMIHLHVRDSEGRHTLDVGLYREAVKAVHGAVGGDLVVQITTEAVGIYRPEEQIAVVDALRPESVSVALREILPPESDEHEAASFFARMEESGILHQIIVYEPGELARIDELARRGVLPDGPLAVLAVLGRYTEEGATDAEFDAFMAAGIERHQWMLCAFGPRETEFMKRAAAGGGHARVGFENNLWLPDGDLAPSNASLVEAAACDIDMSHRRVATADDLRRLWRKPASASTRASAAAEQPGRPDLRHGLSGQTSTSPQGNVQNKETRS
ncbi:3-keto-5-aminohexanoate cleavage protein [Aquamicrobium sp. LC103]|uniref:3-keto-5-aminohexanoate cleavage protein n=1 Tax=Aquamicrobium sp. LC103 TaxID=1120658 RepID=UPI0009E3B445|nr:3-keto-5-aminohexanoate cleavage protein [Aquamicrobium sp. LC103]TKT82683.1 3-keto-5-aminohexanoate cleavage protein [Aquamicrobium sp. LC103]